MNKDIAKRWTERLRSGNIPQQKKRLGNPNGARCCLGVLCDIAVEDGIIDLPLLRGDILLYENDGHGLPEVVRDWAGMNSCSGVPINFSEGIPLDLKSIEIDREQVPFLNDLVDLNDLAEATFAEIADVIDDNVDRL